MQRKSADGDKHSAWLSCSYDEKSEMEVVGAEGGIVLEGIAESLDRRGNPLFSRTRSEVGELVLFVACQSIPARFIAVSNTGITPQSRKGGSGLGWPGRGEGRGSYRRVSARSKYLRIEKTILFAHQLF
jgi:hypothetical protein